MKKIIILLVVMLIIPIKVFAYSARNIIALDMDTNRILYEKNIHDKHLIASITKIMTAIIAIENADLESNVLITNSVLKSFGSGIYVEVGENIKLKDLLYGLMLRSGNDAAIAIAEYVSKDITTFVNIMNDKAKELGMKNTTFINPHGLENELGEGNISTAYDMAILTSYAMQNQIYQEIVQTKKYTAKTDKKTYTWTNKNKLLSSYKYATGGKTGFTKKAQRTLVSTATKENKNIAIVTLNDPNDWLDHETLYENIFKEYHLEKIIAKDNFTINQETFYQNYNLYIKEDVYLLLKKSEKSAIALDIQLQKKTNIEENDCIGTIQIKLNNTILKEIDVFISHKTTNNTPRTNIFQKIMRWFKRD